MRIFVVEILTKKSPSIGKCLQMFINQLGLLLYDQPIPSLQNVCATNHEN